MLQIIKMPLLGLCWLCTSFVYGQGNPWSSARPDGHAPISIMGDHTHHQGEIMFSYRYMPMWMEGNLRGTDEISNEAIYQEYMVAPQTMRMDMHMAGIMYAPTNKLTLIVMGNYLSNTMDLRTGMGSRFTTQSAGMGDLRLSGLVQLLNKKSHAMHVNAGISIPTGSIDQRDDTPMMENAPLAYPMQLGSGTWDPILGFTYLGQTDRFSWGLQPMFTLRTGENSAGYRFGNIFQAVGWGAVRLSNVISISGSIRFRDIHPINGVDPDLNPMMMPLFDTANSGTQQLDLGTGINAMIPTGALKNLRLAVEVQWPVYQEVTGIQMKQLRMATLGLQYAIGHH